MSLIRRSRTPLLVLLGILASAPGCRRAEPIPYATWRPPLPSYRPATGSNNAYDGYLLAATQAQTVAPREVNRVEFTPGMRASVQNRLGPALSTVRAATRKTCRFEYQPVGPSQPRPYRTAWRLIGRAMVWRVEDALKVSDWDTAITWVLASTKFGIDLSGGCSADASLGYAIADEARRAIAPRLGEIPPAPLGRLSSGIAAALRGAPSLRQTLDNEHENMLAAVQYVQDCYRDRKLDALRQTLGRGARDAVDYLSKMPESERPRYFAGFAAEADDEVRTLIAFGAKPRATRPEPPTRKGEYRPWRRLSTHYFSGGRPLMDLRDQFLARTRLLVLTSRIHAAIATSGAAPASIASFPEYLRKDPFSGRDFVYRASSSDYKLYSVGRDLRDDGGESDEAGVEPDLVLEDAGL